MLSSSTFIIWWVNNWLVRLKRVIRNRVTSGWGPVNTGIVQSSTLGTVLFKVLFNIFINCMNTGLECMHSKVAGDTQLGGTADCLKGWEALTNWRGGQSSITWYLIRASSILCIWDRTALDICTDWGIRGQRAVF